MDVNLLIEDLIEREGGYVSHPADRGGPTNWGITQALARQHGYAGDMRSFSRTRAASIYRSVYWKAPGFDRAALQAPALAAELFDTGVNMGPPIAISFLQRALNALNRNAQDYPDLKTDGRIGPATLDALARFLTLRPGGEAVLMKAIDALQGERYIALAESRPANEAFVYGWLANRIG